MKLEALHHITMITGDAQKNVAFYADVLGLRLVKKTVNFDQPEAYHLYFGDETGAPGSSAKTDSTLRFDDYDDLQLELVVADDGNPPLRAEHPEVPAIYFREPRGILFEIATLSPGIAADEDPDRLGEELRVPKMHAHLREELEQKLTPVVTPRTARREGTAA